MNFLTIVENKLTLQREGQPDVAVTSLDQLVELVGGADCMCSSSVDFPEEYTSDPQVIALCASLKD